MIIITIITIIMIITISEYMVVVLKMGNPNSWMV